MTREKPRVLVVGHQAGRPPPGIPELTTGARYLMAADMDAVRSALEDCDVVFHYGPPHDALRSNWSMARRLRWLHIGAVGVDWALFPGLRESDVTVTNSQGIFDGALSEYVLALMLALVKDVPGTTRAQAERRWHPRVLGSLAGAHAVIVGAGTVGRAIGRLLRSIGLDVTLVARSGRPGVPGEGRILAITALRNILPSADWLIIAAPLTADTEGLIGAPELGALPPRAHVINIGRGPIVVEAALSEAVASARLAGAALDVFEDEPLAPQSPLWSLPTVIVSPHTAGTIAETPALLTAAFLDNLGRYVAGQALKAVVDKNLGFVRSGD